MRAALAAAATKGLTGALLARDTGHEHSEGWLVHRAGIYVARAGPVTQSEGCTVQGQVSISGLSAFLIKPMRTYSILLYLKFH